MFQLGIPIYWNTLLAVCIVSYAVVMYAQNPVKSSGASPEINAKNRTTPQSNSLTVTKNDVKFKKLVKFQKEVAGSDDENHDSAV
jgi:hypothetical protein